MKMLDVYGGDDIKDFDQLKASGMPICTKVTEGRGWKDINYDYRYKECKKRGIPISFYHMLTKNADVEGQAIDFWNEVKNYENDMLNMLDIEYENIPNAEEYANRFINKYRELSGQDILVYSYRSYFKERFSQSFLNSHNLWVADYCSRQPNFQNLVVWQYSESCKDYWWVGNNEGCVDINNVLREDILFRKEFNNYNAITQQVTNLNNPFLELQRELNVQGFRDKNGNTLIEDGIIGDLTISALPMIKKGANGNITRWIQSRVGAVADGVFGDETENAVIGFQSKYGLVADGVVGINTWNKIFEIMGVM